MRIEERVGSRRKQLPASRVKTSPRVESSQFFKVLAREQIPSAEAEMDKLLRQLDEHGNRLIHSCTLVDLNHYKKIVYQILRWTIGEGVGLKESHSIDGQGRSRVYRTVEQINEQLVQLTDDILERETNRLHLLEKIGQIKGFLIQLNA